MRSGFLLFVALLAAPSPGPPRRAAAKVTILLSQESPAYRAAAEGFRSKLQGDGIVAEVDIRPPGVPNADQLLQMRAHPPDLILALGGPAATVAAAAHFGSVPVVAVMLRRSDFAPLGPATGVYLEFPVELQLQWLRRVLPKVRRIGVVYNPAENTAIVERASAVAAGLGLELVLRKVDTREHLPDALASLANDVQVLWGIADTLVLTPETARSFLLFQFRQRIPFAGLSDAWVRAGALYALDRDWTDLGRQCAELAEQVLRGRDPKSLDPLPPRMVLLTLNRHTAETLQLQLPAEALRQVKEPGR